MKQVTLLLLLSFSLNMAYAQNDTAAAEKYIRAARIESNAAIAKKDVDGVAKYWMHDFVEIIGMENTKVFDLTAYRLRL